MSRIARIYRFTRRRADGLVTGSVITLAATVGVLLLYGRVQQHDEAGFKRIAAEERVGKQTNPNMANQGYPK